MCDHRNPKRGPLFQVGNERKNDDVSLRTPVKAVIKYVA
jgi:hypothetical protein